MFIDIGDISVRIVYNTTPLRISILPVINVIVKIGVISTTMVGKMSCFLYSEKKLRPPASDLTVGRYSLYVGIIESIILL